MPVELPELPDGWRYTFKAEGNNQNLFEVQLSVGVRNDSQNRGIEVHFGWWDTSDEKFTEEWLQAFLAKSYKQLADKVSELPANWLTSLIDDYQNAIWRQS